VRTLEKSEIQGLRVYSPDGRRYLVNKEDEKGTTQVYVADTGSTALVCLTCVQAPSGPRPERFKMHPHWHPSGRWIFLTVERDVYTPTPLLGLSRKYVEGQLQNGLWTNMWAMSPDGRQWHRLTDFGSGGPGTPNGFIGTPFTPDGRRAVWSQIVDGNVFRYRPFGRWELILADFEEVNGAPRLVNRRNITPEGMHWNEPGNFAPDNVSLVLTGSTEPDAQGMDQYVMNIESRQLTNLTNSPTVWDEHGVFSPDGRKILFMSAYPYRDDPKASRILSIRTEFMLMNADGSALTQLTHYRERGYPEYGDAGTAAAPSWSHDGRSATLSRLYFPDYEYWEIEFQGPCGRASNPR
jgi:Tol biopolymer transport system component